MATLAAGGGTLNINIGVMGHVDSGKTSLVKTLSTMLSTAALDKHKQSQERGITLDLGFSSFTTGLPAHLVDNANVSTLQFTLVDCPGHASLIRTIIGGAQIIDMMILVVDITKGIQTQTAECIVIGEICCAPEDVIIVLNKVDLLDAAVRDAKVAKAKAQLSKVFAKTVFRDAPMITVAAVVGGEKVAAMGGSKSKSKGAAATAAAAAAAAAAPAAATNNPADAADAADTDKGAAQSAAATANGTVSVAKAAGIQTIGIEELVRTLKSRVRVPQRNPDGNMLFAIDHCFPIRGKGTVLTGTVLRGTLNVNMPIEIASLRAEKKIKSMQMFRRPVNSATQGDRVGVCVAGLDASLVERGLATTPGTVPTIHAAVAYVRKIRFFKGTCASKTKIHITAGHATVMATVRFFGWREAQELAQASGGSGGRGGGDGEEKNSGGVRASTPARNWSPGAFDAAKDYCYQDALVPPKAGAKHGQFALLEFDTPLICPVGSIIIASRLDADAGGDACRLVFHGKLLQAMEPGAGAFSGVKIFKMKERVGSVVRIKGPQSLIISGMFSKESDISRFMNMKVTVRSHDGNSDVQGRIEGKFGSSGKLVIGVDDSSNVKPKSKVSLAFKRYIFDEDKKSMHQ